MSQEEAPVLLTPPEVAELLRTSTQAIYDLARKGAIPHLRLGRRRLFDRADTPEWLREKRAPSPKGERRW